MKSALEVACAAMAIGLTSISARHARPVVWHGSARLARAALPATLSIMLLLGAPLASAQNDLTTPSGQSSLLNQLNQSAQPAQVYQPNQVYQIGTGEPLRPARTEPYDGAIAAYQDGRLQDALAVTDAALLVDPRNPRLRFLRGVILTDTQQPQAASDIFRAMIRDFPELPEPYNNLAVIQAAAGDFDGARQSLEQSIMALPSYAMARENLGDIYLQLAIRSYEEAGRLDTRNPSARRKLSIAREMIVKLPSAAASTPPRSRAQP
jgi:tetratricopeptide (TPR) repeat protein